MKKKNNKDINKNIQILLIIVITIIMSIIMSVIAYQKILGYQKGMCWKALRDSTKMVNHEINVVFKDNINSLHLVAEEMSQEEQPDSYETMKSYLEAVQQMTIFSGIDVIYPDNTVLLQNGEKKDLGQELSFAKIAAQGEHMSQRMTDVGSNKNVVYYYIPVIKDNRITMILAGVIDCAELSDIFSTSLYEEKANVYIVDTTDGNFIMNSGKQKLDNIHQMSEKKAVKGYERGDLAKRVNSGNSGIAAYESETNGKNFYLYYTPVGSFQWELLLEVQENTMFASAFRMKRILARIGGVEAILLIIYFVWNVITLRQLSKSREEAIKQIGSTTALIQCVTELSSNTNMDLAINNLLEIVNSYFGGDRSYIYEIDYSKQVVYNTYEYVTKGVSAKIQNAGETSLETISTWMDKFRGKGIFYISNIEDEKRENNSRIYNILKERNVESLIAVPLIKGEEVLGFAGVDNPRKCYEDLNLLSSIQFFINNSIETKRQQEQLRYLSYQDMLTNLYNRNKFIKQVEAYTQHEIKNIGVAYMDLNSLKKVNDEHGHEAGDNLIRKTAKQITSVFPESAYRVGGDEFVIIFPEVERAEFYKKTEELRGKLKANGISISFGAVWSEICEDLEELLKEADKLMYEDKKKHYTE